MPVSTGRLSRSMRLPWVFRRRRVRTRVVPTESRRDEMLGEAAPPLVAEPEDRAGGLGWARASERRPRKAHRLRPSTEGESRGGDHGSLGAPKPSPNPRRLWASGGMRTQGQTRLSSRQPGRRRSRTRRNLASGARSRQRRGQTPAASLCAQGRDRGRPHDGGRGGGDRGSELAASFASAGGGAGHARGSADEGDGAVRRVGDGSAEGGAKCRWRAAAGA